MRDTVHLRNQVTATVDHARNLTASETADRVLETVRVHEWCRYCHPTSPAVQLSLDLRG